jgi:hypothetical protein
MWKSIYKKHSSFHHIKFYKNLKFKKWQEAATRKLGAKTHEVRYSL